MQDQRPPEQGRQRPQQQRRRAGDVESLIRRILVAVDASEDATAALEAAVELAAATGAEIQGAFVEEDRILRAGRLSMCREISLFSDEAREIGHSDLERQLRAHARRLQAQLQQAAERAQVPWSFTTLRGEVVSELRRAARDSDLVALGATGRSYKEAPGSTVDELVSEAPAPVLVLRRATRLGLGVHALYDGTEAGQRAVALAAELSRREQPPLTVFLLADDDDTGSLMAERLGGWLTERGIQPRFRRLPPAETGRLSELLSAERCGLFVAPRSSFQGDRSSARKLLRHADFPVMLVG